MVVDQINSELAQLDKDVGTINGRVNRHCAEIDESRSQLKVTDKLVSDLARRLEVLEERDVLREGQLQSLLEEVERLRGVGESKGKEVDRGESPFLLRKGMLTTNLEGLFAMIPRAESELSYATPRSTLEPILSDEEEELAEPVGFHPVVGEGEPEWDEGPEHEGEVFDISPTFYRAPSSLDPNDVGESTTPTGWQAYSPPISQAPNENEEAIPVPEPGSPSLLVGTLNRAHRLHEGLNYSGRGSPVRGHPYVIALEGSRRGRAYRYSHQRNSDQSGGWGGEVSDSIAEGSGSGGSHSD